MHELSLCQNILQIINEQSVLKGFRKVNKICLEIGEFANVDKIALEFGFDVVMEGTIAADAEIEFVDTPASAQCKECNKTFLMHRRFDPCTHCGSHDVELLTGEELSIRELEVE